MIQPIQAGELGGAALLTACPATAPTPQVDEHEVFQKLKKLKNTKSTLPIDITNKLRNKVAVELPVPLTHIINACLTGQVYPALWKKEWISPVPTIMEPEVIKHVRKIAGTSDYNKVLESFLKEAMIKDVHPNLNPKQ